MQIENSKAYGNNYNDAHSENGWTVFGSDASGNNFVNIHADQNLGHGMVISDGANNNTVTGSTFLSNSFNHSNFYSGIDIIDASGNVIQGNTLYNLLGGGSLEATQRNGIMLDDESHYNIIKNNNCIGNLNHGIDIWDNASGSFGDNIVADNQGDYKTFNQGTTANLANGDEIPHNMGVTPTNVVVTCATPIYEDIPVIATYTSADSTNIYACIVWINGTIITDNAITVNWIAYYNP